MKKTIFAAILIFASLTAFCLTPANTFQCNIKTNPGIPKATISASITHGNYENYRLLNKPTTLVFDNGFEVILFSAHEMQTKGLISDISGYQSDFIAQFKMPVFHMTPDGKVSAEYSVVNSKYSTEKR